MVSFTFQVNSMDVIQISEDRYEPLNHFVDNQPRSLLEHGTSFAKFLEDLQQSSVMRQAIFSADLVGLFHVLLICVHSLQLLNRARTQHLLPQYSEPSYRKSFVHFGAVSRGYHIPKPGIECRKTHSDMCRSYYTRTNTMFFVTLKKIFGRFSEEICFKHLISAKT